MREEKQYDVMWLSVSLVWGSVTVSTKTNDKCKEQMSSRLQLRETTEEINKQLVQSLAQNKSIQNSAQESSQRIRKLNFTKSNFENTKVWLKRDREKRSKERIDFGLPVWERSWKG